MTPSEGNDPAELMMRAHALQLRMLAGIATVAAATTDAAIATRRFTRAWQAAERRDVDAVLFEHDDLVELDMSDAYWRPS